MPKSTPARAKVINLNQIRMPVVPSIHFRKVKLTFVSSASAIERAREVNDAGRRPSTHMECRLAAANPRRLGRNPKARPGAEHLPAGGLLYSSLGWLGQASGLAFDQASPVRGRRPSEAAESK